MPYNDKGLLEETRLLREAIEASIAAAASDTKGEYFHDAAPYMKHIDDVEKANAAWKEYDLCIWAQRYAA